MVYAEYLGQPSIFESARAGDLRALSYLINTYLRPEGISAKVAPQIEKVVYPFWLNFNKNLWRKVLLSLSVIYCGN